MPNTLTVTQLQDAKAMIANGDLQGFYSYMASQGYGYANLANEMVQCYGTAGQAAQNYMVASARQQGRDLTQTQIIKIEKNMASAYANALINDAQGDSVRKRFYVCDKTA